MATKDVCQTDAATALAAPSSLRLPQEGRTGIASRALANKCSPAIFSCNAVISLSTSIHTTVDAIKERPLEHRCKMLNFPDQLVRASTTLGTMLDVALILEVDPVLVYGWIAGVDLPTKERIEEFNARLEPLILPAA